MRDKLVAEKHKTLAEFEGMHQLLRDQEQTILRKLEEMEVKLSQVEKAKVTKLSLQISSIGALITEIEAACKQPAEELLKEVRSTLSKCENITFQKSGTMKAKKLSVKNVKKTPECQASFLCDTILNNPIQLMKNHKVKVTLDPDTAHQSLTLSEGGRRASGAAQAMNTSFRNKFASAHVMNTSPYNEGVFAPRVTQNTKRFTASHCVLGREGYSSGRHYWELQLLQNQGVSLGIAGESAMKQVWVLWAVKYGGQQLPNPLYDRNYCFQPQVNLGVNLQYVSFKNLGVYLDYDGGQLSVYDTDTMQPLYTFKGAAFTQKVYPYFMLEDGADLRLI
ncbi:E3 ubiquitin-protein ligase TRIM15-like [Ambystoma mexicanum]|uniref:E3 ubiquitin-protein ligase TRIM15-like n=1 Tax=Ambystoma mexicanum TaxID=8296 RepID=UPI0037E72C0B